MWTSNVNPPDNGNPNDDHLQENEIDVGCEIGSNVESDAESDRSIEFSKYDTSGFDYDIAGLSQDDSDEDSNEECSNEIYEDEEEAPLNRNKRRSIRQDDTNEDSSNGLALLSRVSTQKQNGLSRSVSSPLLVNKPTQSSPGMSSQMSRMMSPSFSHYRIPSGNSSSSSANSTTSERPQYSFSLSGRRWSRASLTPSTLSHSPPSHCSIVEDGDELSAVSAASLAELQDLQKKTSSI